MPQDDYMPRDDAGKAATMEQFAGAIALYATALGVSAPEVSGQSADAAYFHYTLNQQGIAVNNGQQWTGWKNFVRDGSGGSVTSAPAFPTAPAGAPAAVLPGILPRFRALVKKIKTNANYTSSIGQALGVEGPQQTGPDLTTIQPDFDGTVSGNQVNLGWGWGGNGAYLDMIRLEVDRSDGKGFVFLANDTTPGYTDSMPFPAAPTKWTYRGIYIVGDEQVGQWSKSVSVTVGG